MTVAGSSSSDTHPSEQATGSGRKVTERFPIVLLHGFTQTGVSWTPILGEMRRLAPSTDVHAPDLAGHGTAAHDLDGSTLSQMAEQMVQRFGRALWVGYSMGGRTALRLALDHPDSVAGLVLIGATAGIADAGERADRRSRDEQLANRIEDEGVERFLESWLTQPLFAGLEVPAEDLLARRANRAAGLAASLRHAGTGTMEPPWWGELDRMSAPVRIIAGANDTKFVDLGRRMASAVGPNAVFETVDGCGHAAHIERPESVARSILEMTISDGDLR